MKDHTSRIDKITDEVGELHPLLSSLFDKMDQVLSFEYTHGPVEMGADFVLQTTHPVLGTTIYIGVVAKCGQIKMNFTDVERQIEECMVKRFYDNGKKEVYLSEIWVICNGTITNATQRKINEKFKSSHIQFINGKTLKQLVEKFLPHYRYDIPIEIGDYINTSLLANDLDEQRFSLFEACDRDFYIEPDVYEMKDSEYVQAGKKRKPKRYDVYETALDGGVVILEGAMGTGKSRLFRQIVRKYGTVPPVYSIRPMI